jgi:hypothetical protein
MKIVEFYEENCRSWSRNFRQEGAGAAQKWAGSATLVPELNVRKYLI